MSEDPMGDIARALEGLRGIGEAILTSLNEVKTLSKNQATEKEASTATVETPTSSSSKAEGGGGGSGSGSSSGPGLFGRGALTASEIVRDLASPYSSRAEVGLSSLEGAGGGIGAAIGTWIGGPVGGKIGKTLGDAAGSAALGETKFELDATKRELNSYLSGLAGVGIVASPEQAREARDFFAQQAALQSQALKAGAESLDATFLGNLLTGSATSSLSSKDSENLASIADVAKKVNNSDYGVGGRQ